jgi:mannose-6-phosphate isomerase
VPLIKFVPRPYKLFNKIQHYDWGSRDANAFIPEFLGIKPQPDTPYAELWIGAHPKAPSEIQIDEKRVPLNEIIAEFSRECLGEYVSRKFSGRLPFLLKVLSAAEALSIQTHPNKDQAVRLHASYPDKYPDDNHKPEIAIALDSLTALVGFKPAAKIAATLRALPELPEYAERRLVDAVIEAGKPGDRETAIRELYADIMRKTDKKEKLSSCIFKIRERLSHKTSPTPEEAQFLEQYEVYGADVGLLSFFFFNLVHLKRGQAMFTAAGVPHAYIKGNIVECMANSDNVVRAGLTSKFRDVETLLDILKYNFGECEILNSGQKMDEVTYNTEAEEFKITRFKKGAGFKKLCRSNDRPSVCLIAGGEIEIVWSHAGVDHLHSFSRGDSFFIPAFLSEYRMSSIGETDFFRVEIP